MTPAMPRLRTRYYFDTVTLSNFALSDRLGLLVRRYGKRLHITHEVLAEIAAGAVGGYPALLNVEALAFRGAFTMAPPMTSRRERTLFRTFLQTIDPGEASCLACSSVRGGIIATDDRAAREICRSQGIHVTGTIGILKTCCDDGALRLDEADRILDSMVSQGYRSPVARISDLE